MTFPSFFKRFLLSFCLGGLSLFSFPPFGVFFLIFISWGGCIKLLQTSRSAKEAFWVAFSFGWGVFFLSDFWVSFSFLQVGQPLLLGFLATSLIAAFLALYVAVAGLLWYKTRSGKPIKDAFLWGAFIFMVEWLRQHLGIPIPLSPPSLSLISVPLLAQSASLWGSDGLSFWIVTVSALGGQKFSPPKSLIPFLKNSYHATLPSLLFLILSAIFGFFSLRAPTRPLPNMAIHLIQPGIRPSQRAKDPLNTLKLLLYLSQKSLLPPQKKSLAHPTYLIWPESALGNTDAHALSSFLRQTLPPETYLLSGVISPQPNGQWHNDLGAWSTTKKTFPQGQILSSKTRLVPFGEYIPFASYLPISIQKKLSLISKRTQQPSKNHFIRLTSSTDSQTLTLFPLICYDALFQDLIIPPDLNEVGKKGSFKAQIPHVFLFIGNTGWYDSFVGAAQIAAQTRFRSIEWGRPMLRVDMWGYSLQTDAFGQVRQILKAGETGSLSVFPMEERVNLPLFHHLPRFLWPIGMGFFLLLLIWSNLRQSLTRKKR